MRNLRQRTEQTGSLYSVQCALRSPHFLTGEGVLVMDADRLVGILSERDYARKVILRGKASRDTSVGEIMTRRVVYVRPEQTAEECMALMTDKRVRHLPVLEDDRVVGVISIGDVVKNIISEQEFLIEQLERYISGTAYP